MTENNGQNSKPFTDLLQEVAEQATGLDGVSLGANGAARMYVNPDNPERQAFLEEQLAEMLGKDVDLGHIKTIIGDMLSNELYIRSDVDGEERVYVVQPNIAYVATCINDSMVSDDLAITDAIFPAQHYKQKSDIISKEISTFIQTRSDEQAPVEDYGVCELHDAEKTAMIRAAEQHIEADAPEHGVPKRIADVGEDRSR